MSLKDPDDNYDGGIDFGKKSKRGKISMEIGNETKIKLIILLFGIILGIFLAHYFVEPFVGSLGREDCRTCLTEKEYLKMTNYCLMKEVEEPQKVLDECSVQYSIKDKNN